MVNYCIDCNKEMLSPKAKRCWDCTVLFRKAKPSISAGKCDICYKKGSKRRVYKAEDNKRCCINCYEKHIRSQREEVKQKRHEYNRLPEVKAAKKVCEEEHKEEYGFKRSIRDKKRRQTDPIWKEKRNLQTKQWFEENKDDPVRIQSYNLYFVERQKTDINFRLACNLRKRMSAIIKGQKKGSAVKDLGCSIEQFRIHIESLFQPGMNWDNYGLHGWHLDHKYPLSKFELTNREQFLKACHYTNLQPLWAIDNIQKSNKVD